MDFRLKMSEDDNWNFATFVTRSIRYEISISYEFPDVDESVLLVLDRIVSDEVPMLTSVFKSSMHFRTEKIVFRLKMYHLQRAKKKRWIDIFYRLF